MLRLVTVGLTAMLAILAGDVAFRASLLRLVRPVILEPADGAVVIPPVRVHWEGPEHMRVTLRYAGRETWDLGVRVSPFEMPADYFTDRGLYSVEISSTVLGDWVTARRAFSATIPAESPPAAGRLALGEQLAELQKSMMDLKASQEEVHDENTNLYEENASIREENAILTEELQRLADAERQSKSRIAGLEREYERLSEDHRALLDEASRLRLRLASVIPCSVWGFHAYPRPQTIPASRRVISVSTLDGEVFRTREQCEAFRRGDPTSASPCFCVGNSWGE